MKKFLGILVLMLIAWDLRGAPLTRTIVVFPFVNRSARPDLTWMSEGFAEALSRRLSGPDRFVLGRRKRQAAYDDLGLSNSSPATLASIYKVAESLGVEWGVVGDFNLQANQLTVQARLLEMRDLKLSAPISAAGELADLVDIETSLAWRLLARHDPTFTVGKEEDFRRQFPTVRLDAFESYIRGVMAADSDDRERYFVEADRRNPADHRAAFELGRLNFNRKDYSQAVTWLKKITPSDRHYLESQFLLGVVEYFLDHDQDAIKDFSVVASEFPLPEVYNNLGVLKYRAGDYKQALGDLDRAAQDEESNDSYAFNRGLCLWSLKEYPEAAAALKAVLDSDNEDAEAHFLLADTLVRLGDKEGADAEEKWLDAHDGSNSSSASLTPDTAPQPRITEDYEGQSYRLSVIKARNAFEVKVAHLPPAEHGAAHIERARGFINAGRPEEAQADLEEAASLAPANNEVHLLLARVYEVEGRRADAAAQLEVSLRLDNSASAQSWLARIYLAEGRRSQALDHARAALELEPANQAAGQIIHELQASATDSRSKP